MQKFKSLTFKKQKLNKDFQSDSWTRHATSNLREMHLFSATQMPEPDYLTNARGTE